MTARIKDELVRDSNRRSTAQAIQAMKECTDITRMRDVVAAISSQITVKEIAETFAKEMRDKEGKQKREYVGAYMEMLARLERLEGSLTEDDATKLADEQIDAMLAEYGHHLKDNGQRGIHTTDGGAESGAPEGVAGAAETVG